VACWNGLRRGRLPAGGGRSDHWKNKMLGGSTLAMVTIRFAYRINIADTAPIQGGEALDWVALESVPAGRARWHI
jgi:hypothetical protein